MITGESYICVVWCCCHHVTMCRLFICSKNSHTPSKNVLVLDSAFFPVTIKKSTILSKWPVDVTHLFKRQDFPREPLFAPVHCRWKILHDDITTIPFLQCQVMNWFLPYFVIDRILIHLLFWIAYYILFVTKHVRHILSIQDMFLQFAGTQTFPNQCSSQYCTWLRKNLFYLHIIVPWILHFLLPYQNLLPTLAIILTL